MKLPFPLSASSTRLSDIIPTLTKHGWVLGRYRSIGIGRNYVLILARRA